MSRTLTVPARWFSNVPQNIRVKSIHAPQRVVRTDSLRRNPDKHLSDLVFNLYKVGMLEWEDRKLERVVLPMTTNGRTVDHNVSRDLKQLSIVTHMSAGGQCLALYFVTSQASEPA
jgi:hypothetical protein